MPKLEFADIESGVLKPVFDDIAKSRGWVSNALRSLAHAPDGLRVFQAVGHYARYGTELTEVQRELVILITGRGSHYAWTHHSPLGKQIGITDAQLDAIKAGKVPSGLSPQDAALCAYVFAFTSFGGVSDAVMSELKRWFTPRQITDISLISGYYLGLGAVLVALDVEVEGPEILKLELDWQSKQMAKA